jgi:hypothetical protein
MRYLAIGNNAKTIKSDKGGEYLTAIMYLAPADTVPGINVCPMAELAQCKAPCLFTAGRGAMRPVQDARIAKTVAFRDDRDAFMRRIVADIREAEYKADKLGVRLAVRLNGTSDITWEHFPVFGFGGVEYDNLMEMFPAVQFYDYTKLPGRKLPANYHLTVSYSGANPAYAAKAAKTKHNLAVVFHGALPKTFLGRPVIDGDANDLRFLDPAGVVVGLSAKGKAKKDTSGFVIIASAA